MTNEEFKKGIPSAPKSSVVYMKVGGCYLNREGDLIEIVSFCPERTIFPFEDSKGEGYTDEGKWWRLDKDCRFDLVSHATKPTPQTPVTQPIAPKENETDFFGLSMLVCCIGFWVMLIAMVIKC